MFNILLRSLLIVVFLCFAYLTTNAQTQKIDKDSGRNVIVVGAGKTAKVTGKVALVVVKETAEIGWEATKLTTKEVAAPIAKTIFLKAMPKIIKKAAPIATKAAIKYFAL